jgi:2,3-bisphosphoglycerate-independent phosphoglycerate mutase
MQHSLNKKPIVLCVLDGWGIAPKNEKLVSSLNNAIIDANPEFYNYLLSKYPNTELTTSGKDVGLPVGQMGNSEVGHMTIGSGRIIYQDLVRINNAIELNIIQKNEALESLIATLKNNKKACHIIGLISDGGVHSHIEHLIFMAKFVAHQGIKVYLHLITDGRDTAPQNAQKFIQQVIEDIEEIDLISIATISGRYYAMDRDKRYDRIKRYYDTIIDSSNKTFEDPLEVITKSYSDNIYDEFIVPQSNFHYQGMEDGDGVIMINFRADRMRQLALSLFDPHFTDFKREKIINFSEKLTMVEYSKEINAFSKSIFPALVINNTLPEILSQQDLSQLRIAETEKYAHVTFFFNAGREIPFKGEDRILINSPKVTTYDQSPEMSAYELTERLLKEILSGKYDFILVNFANTDMVGHTGNYHATIKAVKSIDKCLEKIYSAITEIGGILIITADHGNAEKMFDEENNNVHTSHTTYPVPFIIVNDKLGDMKLKNGTLADIAPTILNLMSLKTPQDMTGKNLIVSN